MKAIIIIAIFTNLLMIWVAPELGAGIKKGISLSVANYVYNLSEHKEYYVGREDAVTELYRNIRKEVFDPTRPHILLVIPSVINAFALLLILLLSGRRKESKAG